MDKDTFEGKLREARRQKSLVEEELEAVSERWRNERRRLNAEIDRLEAALADAKQARKKVPGKATTGIDPVEVAKMQAAADERVKKAEQQFDGERERLKAEITRLQGSVAEMIERSNNPMRSTEPIRKEFQAQLDEAYRAKQILEEELYRTRLSYEEEKLRLTSELQKLRRGGPQPVKPLKGKSDDDDRMRQLQQQLDEAVAKRSALERELSAARKEVMADAQSREQAIRQESAREIQQLNNAVAALHEQTAKAERRAKEAEEVSAGRIEHLKGVIESLEAQLAEAGNPEGARQIEYLTNVVRSLEQQLAEAQSAVDAARQTNEQDQDDERRRHEKLLFEATHQLEEYQRNTAALENQLKEALTQLEAQRTLHESEIQQLQEKVVAGDQNAAGADMLDQIRKEYDEKMYQMLVEKSQLAEELQRANQMLDEERSRSSSVAADSASGSSTGLDQELINSEIQRVEQMIAEIARLIDDPVTELSVVIRKNVERAELDAYLKGILFTLGRSVAL